MAIMYDMDWVRSKDDIIELFGKKQVLTANGKDAFPRLPLWAYFTAKSVYPDRRGFDFQFVGVYLKSQLGGGSEQRKLAADKLSFWMEDSSSNLDSDIIIMGDFNKSPDRKNKEWASFYKLQNRKFVHFSDYNDTSDFSHLYYERKSKIGSRLDLAVVSQQASSNIIEKPDVVR